jgi:MFS family permease
MLHRRIFAGPRGSAAAVPAFIAFAAFGCFWGAWGASIPAIQRRAGVTDGQLGLALLLIAAGALPAMLLAGRAVDRWGRRVAALLVTALGAAGAVLPFLAVNVVGLAIGLAVVGAASGATDVAMNAVAGRAEAASGRPVITRAHGVFSTFVVLADLGTGGASALSASIVAPFIVVAIVSLAAGLALGRPLPPVASVENPPAGHGPPSTTRPLRIRPLLLIGGLGAVAFASENAQQSWSAVFVHGEVHAGTALAAVAPATFAASVAVMRFAAGVVPVAFARHLLRAGAVTAATGALVLAGAPNFLIAVIGLVLAGFGTAVLFPTLLGIVSRNVDEDRRGRATSLVTTVSYLGFLLGPVYVGGWAAVGGLRTAMVAISGLAVALLLLAPPLLRLSGFAVASVGDDDDRTGGRGRDGQRPWRELGRRWRAGAHLHHRPEPADPAPGRRGRS